MLGIIPPQALDLEEVILGALLIESTAYSRVSDIISADSFYSMQHGEVFKAITSLFAKSSSIDILTVAAELRKAGKLEEVGGAFFITDLTSRVSNSANIVDHARIIHQMFIQRELIRVCSRTIEQAYDASNDVFDLVEFHQSQIFDSVKNTYGRTDVKIDEVIKRRLIAYEVKNTNELTGIGTGYETLDSFTGGWQKTDLIILAARPAMGKTALAMETAKHAALKHGVPVGIFSLEMSSDQLVDRMISSESGVFQDKIKKRNLYDYDWQQIHNNIHKLIDSEIHIDDTPGLTIQALKSKAIRMKERYNIGLIVVDYLQLMEGGKDKSNSNREQEIGKISRGLKMIAKELEVPVIALSQLSRKVEERPGNAKRPMLSDLRESGSIEQDADQVVFLYRPEYYGIEEDEEGNSTAGVTELIFGKNRNGICDTVKLNFNGSLMKFSDPQESVSLDTSTSTSIF